MIFTHAHGQRVRPTPTSTFVDSRPLGVLIHRLEPCVEMLRRAPDPAAIRAAAEAELLTR